MNKIKRQDATWDAIQSDLPSSEPLKGHPSDQKGATSTKVMGDDPFTDETDLPRQQFLIDGKWFSGQSNVPRQHVDQIQAEAIKGDEELIFREPQPQSKLTVPHLYSFFFLLVFPILLRDFSTSNTLLKKRKIVDKRICAQSLHVAILSCETSKSRAPSLMFIWLISVRVALLSNQ